MHKHLKTQNSESYKKCPSEYLDKDRSCTATEPPKQRKLEPIRQISLDDYKSKKLWYIKDSKATKVYKKISKYLDLDSAGSKFENKIKIRTNPNLKIRLGFSRIQNFWTR